MQEVRAGRVVPGWNAGQGSLSQSLVPVLPWGPKRLYSMLSFWQPVRETRCLDNIGGWRCAPAGDTLSVGAQSALTDMRGPGGPPGLGGGEARILRRTHVYAIMCSCILEASGQLMSVHTTALLTQVVVCYNTLVTHD